jgi:predicted nucleic acid-binding protein
MGQGMIHLDTNVLTTLPHLIQKHRFIERIEKNETASVCVPVWYEYMIGPIEASEQNLARQFIRGDVFALETDDAILAAQLFNLAGRKRSLKTDALIAAATIRRKTELFTLNVKDFLPFVKQGLRLFQG